MEVFISLCLLLETLAVILLLGGRDYQPYELPKGFSIYRQMNHTVSNLVYYVDTDSMDVIKDGMIGIQCCHSAASSFVHYCVAEFRSDGCVVGGCAGRQSDHLYCYSVNRCVDKNVFRVDEV